MSFTNITEFSLIHENNVAKVLYSKQSNLDLSMTDNMNSCLSVFESHRPQASLYMLSCEVYLVT